MEKPIDKLELTLFLGGLCMFLSAVEFMLPRPVPFLRLGLANLPLIFALGLLPFSHIMLLVLFKLLGQGIIGGTLISYITLFSAAGSLSSALIMYLLHRIPKRYISLIGISLGGAICGNIVQFFLSVGLIFGDNSLVIAPLFLTMGTLTGLVMGIFSKRFTQQSLWYRSIERRL